MLSSGGADEVVDNDYSSCSSSSNVSRAAKTLGSFGKVLIYNSIDALILTIGNCSSKAVAKTVEWKHAN